MDNRKITPIASGVIYGDKKQKIQDDQVISIVNNHARLIKGNKIKQA